MIICLPTLPLPYLSNCPTCSILCNGVFLETGNSFYNGTPPQPTLTWVFSEFADVVPTMYPINIYLFSGTTNHAGACSSDVDCYGTNVVCYTGSCVCEPGYSLQPDSLTCVTSK